MRDKLTSIILTIIILALFITGCAIKSSVPLPERILRPTGIYHRVSQGETIFRIAKAYNVEMSQIVNANRLSNADRINVDQLLFIPGTREVPAVVPPAISEREDDFIWPLKGKVISFYGDMKGRIQNKGVDIHAKEGEVIVAARSGLVTFVGDRVKGYGKMIIIDHGDDYQTAYAHNSVNLVRQGESVRKDFPVARVGLTGRAEKPLLHFEIRKKHKPCNPLHYLP